MAIVSTPLDSLVHSCQGQALVAPRHRKSVSGVQSQAQYNKKQSSSTEMTLSWRFPMAVAELFGIMTQSEFFLPQVPFLPFPSINVTSASWSKVLSQSFPISPQINLFMSCTLLPISINFPSNYILIFCVCLWVSSESAILKAGTLVFIFMLKHLDTI